MLNAIRFKNATTHHAPVDVLNVRTSASAEWAWVAGRVALGVVAVTGVTVFLRDTPAFGFLIALLAAMAAFNAALAVLLIKGRVKAAFIAGLALDTGSVLAGWTITTTLLAGTQQTNDIYLIFFPILVAGVARLGWPLGVVQAVLFIAWVAGANVILRDGSDYVVQQLPLRVLFMTLTAALTVGLVSQIRLERGKTENLWKESESLAEIGRVISSSPNIDEVYQRFAAEVKKLIPFDRISVSTIDAEPGTMNLRYVEGAETPDSEKAKSHLLEVSLTSYVIQAQRPVRLGVGNTDAGRPLSEADGTDTDHGFRSSLCAPIISDGVAIGALSLHTFKQGQFSELDEGNLRRVADQISGALAIELSHAREVELIEAQGELEAENRELERVNWEKSNFLSSVSHELKTPLTSILAFADVLRRNNAGHLGDKEIEQLDVIRRNGRHLSVLIDDLVDVSKFDSGSLHIEPSEFDVCQLVDDLVESFGPILEEKQQTLTTSLDGGEIWILADRERVAQVITNLLSNASKYSPVGAPIELQVQAEGDRLGIAVRDHGIGISHENIRELFTPFFRADDEDVRSVPGTGLGLAIAKSIVELHDGEISVQSEPGKGSCFWISIPGVIARGADQAHEEPERTIQAA